MLNLNMSPMVKGILIGVGVSAVGFYAYKHNEEKVDNFLRSHGVKVKTPTAGFETMSVEDLMRTKESIEDLIAEKEQQEQSVTVEADAAVGGITYHSHLGTFSFGNSIAAKSAAHDGYASRFLGGKLFFPSSAKRQGWKNKTDEVPPY